MSLDGQGNKRRRNIAENYNRLSRVHERYRQTRDSQTDGRATSNSEREHEFTFANILQWLIFLLKCRVLPLIPLIILPLLLSHPPPAKRPL